MKREDWYKELISFRDFDGQRIFPDKEAEIISKYMNLLKDYIEGKIHFFKAPPERTVKEIVDMQILDYENR